MTTGCLCSTGLFHCLIDWWRDILPTPPPMMCPDELVVLILLSLAWHRKACTMSVRGRQLHCLKHDTITATMRTNLVLPIVCISIGAVYGLACLLFRRQVHRTTRTIGMCTREIGGQMCPTRVWSTLLCRATRRMN